MARGRAGFLKQKSQSDEALELQKQAKKAGLLGSLGSMLGSFALMPLLGPGASVGDKKRKGKDKGQREELARGLNTGAITQGITSGMLAGLTPWLKGGMKDPLFKGGMDRAGAKALQLEKLVTPGIEATATEAATSATLTEKGTKLLERNPQKFLKKVPLSGETAKFHMKSVTKASDIMRDTASTNISKVIPSAPVSTAELGASKGLSKSLTDDLMDLFKQRDETFLG
jgi:hypothetical protein